MMLDIADALPLILEWPGRRPEFLPPPMLALLGSRRNGACKRDFGHKSVSATGVAGLLGAGGGRKANRISLAGDVRVAGRVHRNSKAFVGAAAAEVSGVAEHRIDN